MTSSRSSPNQSRLSNPNCPDFTEFPRFNLPKQSMHRRTETANLCAADLRGYSNQLFQKLEQPWLKKKVWNEVSSIDQQLACSCHHYASILMKKQQEVVANHAKLFPVHTDSDSHELVVYQPVLCVPPKLAVLYQDSLMLALCIN